MNEANERAGIMSDMGENRGFFSYPHYTIILSPNWIKWPKWPKRRKISKLPIIAKIATIATIGTLATIGIIATIGTFAKIAKFADIADIAEIVEIAKISGTEIVTFLRTLKIWIFFEKIDGFLGKILTFLQNC